MTARRWILISLILLASLSGGAALAFAPIVRAQAQQHAQRYGLAIHIGSVRPALVGVTLHDVHVASPLLPAISTHLDRVTVCVDEIEVSGGSVTVEGSRKLVGDQLAAWRARRDPPSPQSGGSSGGRSLSVQGLGIFWAGIDGPGSRLTLADVSVPDAFGDRSVSVGKMEVRHAEGTIDAKDITIAWADGNPAWIRRIEGGSLHARVRLPAGSVSPGSAEAPKRSGAADSTGAGSARAPGSALPETTNDADPSENGTLEPADGSLRDELARVARLGWSPLTKDAQVKVRAFEVEVIRGQEQINFGPGALAAQKKEESVLVELAPTVEAGKTGITFRASIPTGTGPVILDLVGGPISLATLGVRDGNLGLSEVQEAVLTTDAHVKLHADGRTMSFDGKVRAKNVSLEHEKLAPEPVHGLELALQGRGQASLDGSFIQVDEGEIDVGAVQLKLRGTLDRTRPDLRADVHFGIPLVGCQDFLDALPPSLIPVVHGMTAAGTLSLDGHLRFDEANAKDFFLEYAAGNACRITSVPPEVDARRFSHPFSLWVYDGSGKRVQIDRGPGSPGWVKRGGVNHFMEAAVMTCEDGRFRRHRGFDHEAIRNSVKINLEAGKFVRGASTISMQLAKNLYLSRERTVSRKLQELILTTYLEQALTKNQIMTLYLNVIEFGPMVYGVGNAASHYFHTHAHALSLGQAMYLASILPNPDQQHFVQEGRVSDGWMRYLYKLMKIAAKMGWITELERETGLREWVVYGNPDPVTMEPDLDVNPYGDPDAEGSDPFGWQMERPDAVF